MVPHDILAPAGSGGLQHRRLSSLPKVGQGLRNNEIEALEKRILQKTLVDKVLRMGIE